MKTTLVILAAGIGSRFGAGIKQLAAVGPQGEIIMDYSIHDAIEAGFNKIIFIIRRDIEKQFREVIGDRIEKTCAGLGVEVHYAFQDPDRLPAGVTHPEKRVKPWGTGHAVLSCKDLITEPYAVINADDYYGKEAFRIIHDFLADADPADPYAFCMAGFILKNTLSDFGTVTRGICRVNEKGFLTGVQETKNIAKTEDGVAADGSVIDPDARVSMNMWGLTPQFNDLLAEGFEAFLGRLKWDGDELTEEYLLPIFIDELLKQGKVSVRVLETSDKWFGVTYQEDKPAVIRAFKKLVDAGVYSETLYEDLN